MKDRIGEKNQKSEQEIWHVVIPVNGGNTIHHLLEEMNNQIRPHKDLFISLPI